MRKNKKTLDIFHTKQKSKIKHKIRLRWRTSKIKRILQYDSQLIQMWTINDRHILFMAKWKNRKIYWKKEQEWIQELAKEIYNMIYHASLHEVLE